VAVIAPIIQTLISVAAALFGIWLGTRLSRWKDKQQWRRDRCLEAYTDVLRACSIVRDQGSSDWIKREEDERLVERDLAHINLVTQNALNSYRALDRVTLIAPIEVHKSANELISHCCTQFTRGSVGHDRPSIEEWNQINQQYVILYSKFRDAAPSDLLNN
jgi:hypothetical protein